MVGALVSSLFWRLADQSLGIIAYFSASRRDRDDQPDAGPGGIVARLRAPVALLPASSVGWRTSSHRSQREFETQMEVA